MGTLGKILLFFNLLVAGGLVYLATQDWAKRQDVTFNAAQYQLVLVGLPVDGADVPAAEDEPIHLGLVLPGDYKVDEVPAKFLAEYFKGSDGGQALGAAAGDRVATQVGEVKRVQKKVDAQLAGSAADPMNKLALLCGRETVDPATRRVTFTPGWLIGLAETYDEREIVRNLATDIHEKLVGGGTQVNPEKVKANAETAEKMIKKRFAAVLGAPTPSLAAADATALAVAAAKLKEAEAAMGDVAKARAEYTAALINVGTAGTYGESDRRKRIAHLLLHLDPSAGWQKRVALVTGLRTYKQVVGEQVDRYRGMAAVAEAAIRHDQQDFAEQYRVLMGEAERRARLVDRQEAVLADVASHRQKAVEAAQQRSAYLAQRVEDRKAVQAKVDELLQSQKAIEDALFRVQKQVGETLRGNFDLEDQLDKAENEAARKNGK